jgi:tol-pal system protein YbgF
MSMTTTSPTDFSRSLLRASLTAAAILAGSAAAYGQAAGDGSPGFLDGLFDRGGDPAPPRRDRLAQSSASELSVRIDRLEAQIRQMTGVIEELQYRNQQLADQLRRMQGDPGALQSSAQPRPVGPTMAAPSGGVPTAVRPAPGSAQSQAQSPAQGPAPSQPPGRRGDAFDPNQNPAAPGAPRTLGALPVGPGVPNQPPDQVAAEEPPPNGAPGARAAGEPLNLSALSGNAGPDAMPPGGLPPSPEGRGSQTAALPPSESPKDYYDLAYGYILRKDYALAEDGFRTFLRKYPSDRMAPEAQYWLGESLFQRQRFRDAAEAFLNVSTKYESTAKAPDALLRLGQSLAVLGEKEAACASLGEVLRKYPRAALGVKQGVDREQKRDGC